MLIVNIQQKQIVLFVEVINRLLFFGGIVIVKFCIQSLIIYPWLTKQ